MTGKLKLFAGILAGVLLLAGAYLLYAHLSAKYESAQSGNGAKPGMDGTSGEVPLDPAPDFAVYDDQGNAVSLRDYVGKPVVINFWASWCGVCKSELPYFQKAYEDYEGEVQFLMVNLTKGNGETKAKAQEVLQQNGYTFPVRYDLDSSAAYAYSIRAVPFTGFLNSAGELVAVHTGAMSAEKLDSYIHQIYEPRAIG